MNAIIDSENATRLIERQNALQKEANHVLAELGLIAMFAPLGKVKRTGSSVLGLMVWRDVDLLVLCERLSAGAVMETITPLLNNRRVISAHFRYRNPSGTSVDERYYYHALYHAHSGNEWKLDIAFWLASSWEKGGPYDHRAHTQKIRQQLTDEARLTILWLKDIWHRLPSYSGVVSSQHIYDAVLENNVRNPEEFKAYLSDRVFQSNITV